MNGRCSSFEKTTRLRPNAIWVPKEGTNCQINRGMVCKLHAPMNNEISCGNIEGLHSSIGHYYNNYYEISNSTPAYFAGKYSDDGEVCRCTPTLKSSHCSEEATNCNEEDSLERYYINHYNNSNSDGDSDDGLWTSAYFTGKCSDDEGGCCYKPEKAEGD